MSGILRLESLAKGNTLKQGDKTALKYRLFDADGEKLNIAGKSAKVRLVYPDFLTIGYEKDGLTVAQDDTVTFTIDTIIPSRIYHVEIIVDDKFIFPSRADESKFTVDKSSLGTESNIVEIVGVDAVVRKAVDLINEDPNLIIDEDKLVNDIISNTGIGSIEEYYQQFNDVITDLSEEKDYHSLPEIAGARRGYSTLAESLENLSVNMLNPNLGKLTQTHMSDELLTQIAGDTAVNAVPADRSLTTEKFADKSVTPEKTTFVKTKNLFDGVYTKGASLAGSTSLGFSTNYPESISVIKKIEPDTTYTISKASDSDRFSIATFTEYPVNLMPSNRNIKTDAFNIPTTFTTTADEQYVVVYVSTSGASKEPSWLQIEFGSIATDHDEVYVKLSPESFGNIKDLIVDELSNFMTYENEEWYV